MSGRAQKQYASIVNITVNIYPCLAPHSISFVTHCENHTFVGPYCGVPVECVVCHPDRRGPQNPHTLAILVPGELIHMAGMVSSV